MIVIDTDHLSILCASGPAAERLRGRLAASADHDFAITIISIEEQMRGWLADIKRKRKGAELIRPYERLQRLVAFWSFWRLLPFEAQAAARFDVLRSQLRIGSQDLKIAAIAMAAGATLLTANSRDFGRIPGLKFEDWLS
jgi:tRNA(fMet)-specific endonuclease VapC